MISGLGSGSASGSLSGTEILIRTSDRDLDQYHRSRVKIRIGILNQDKDHK